MTDKPGTPVGDWIDQHYAPNSGATHYLGPGDDPGCCAGPHPFCTYMAAWREALRQFASELDETGHPEIAELAREKAGVFIPGHGGP